MIFCCSSFSACKQNLWNPYITIESSDEYFIYHVLEPKKIFGYGETECYIVGLTEKGKEQTCLVVPEYYEEHVINGIGYQERTYLIDTGYHGNFTSENLEKLYIPKNFKRIYGQRYEVYSLYDTYVVYWDSDSYGHRLDAAIKGKIYGYNYYLKRIYPSLSYIDEPIKIANVSYLYNYGEVQNDGYYSVFSFSCERRSCPQAASMSAPRRRRSVAVTPFSSSVLMNFSTLSREPRR